MSLLGKGRRGRRIGLVLAGSLFAFQALAIVGAPVASAAPYNCSFGGGVLTITSSADEVITLQQEVTTRFILINGVKTLGNGNCPGVTTDATTSNTTTINVIGNEFDQTVVIGMYDTGGTTRSWGTINWSVSLGANSGTGVPVKNDNLAIDNSASLFGLVGGPGSSHIDVTAGASGIDLNTDGDLDVTVSGLEGTWVFGGPKDDTFYAIGDDTTGGIYTGKVYFDGASGDDEVAGGAGDDCLADSGVGLDDEDYVDYTAATGSVIASLATGIVTAPGLGVDTLVGTGGPSCGPAAWAGKDGDGNSFEDIAGSAFNDTLTGDLSAFGNFITPGAGDDTVSGAPATGDTGFDYIDYGDSEAGVTIDMPAGTATGNGNDTFTRIEGAYGSAFDDMFIDDIESDNEYYGDDGNDDFDQGADPDSGAGDSDYVDGEGGTDTAWYNMRTEDLTVTLNSNIGDAGPPVTGCGGDVTDPACADGDQGEGEADDLQKVENVKLGTGDDLFVGSAFNNDVDPGGGQNVLDGMGGSDTLDYRSYEAGVEVNMAGGSTGGDAAANFENAKGSDFNDVITGNDLSNTIKARGGKDNVKGGGGDDLVKGGKGNDLLRGGSGDDDIYGNNGNDQLWGGKGTDFCKGGKGKDTIKQCEASK